MKRIALSCILFFLFLNVNAQDWYKQNLSSYASIDFPAKPDYGDTLGQDIYTFTNDTAFYRVSVRDLSNMVAFSLRPEELDKFQDEVIRGSVDAYRGTLVSKQFFQINGLRGLDALITTKDIIGAPDLRFKRVVFVNRTIYQFDFWTYSDQELKTKSVRDKFFNSLSITGDSTTLKQHTLVEKSAVAEPAISAKKEGISNSMIAAIVIGILTAIFAVWLKAKYRNKSKE